MMTDVLNGAARYRAKLQSEIKKIDEFIRFAEELTRRAEPVPPPHTGPQGVVSEVHAERKPLPAPASVTAPPAAVSEATQLQEPRAEIFRIEEAFEPEPIMLASSDRVQEQKAPTRRASLFRGAFIDEPLRSAG